MSKFVVNEEMFGKYCTIPTGCSRAEHIYKIVTRIESNTYCDIPLYSGQTEETTHKDVVPVLLVIHCGIDESEVIRVPLAKCKICGEPDGWINADYEQPNTARDVLVFEKGVGVSIGFFVDGWHMYGSNDFEIKVTYWRELPDLLSEDEVWQTLSRLVRLKTNENS